jgi:hypothetical protein
LAGGISVFNSPALEGQGTRRVTALFAYLPLTP